MNKIIISFFLFFLNLHLVAETKIFKVGLIDYNYDIRYAKWERPPVDIRSKHSIENRAIDGAKLGIIDSKKLQRITKTEITLDHLRVKNEDALIDLIYSKKLKDYNSILLDINLNNFEKIKDIIVSNTNIIFFNISDPNNLLRINFCLDNFYHTYPSNMMRTDALAQFLVQKKWNKTLILTGSLKYDNLLAKSFKTSANKFGVNIVGEKFFVNSNDPRAREKNSLSFLTKGKRYKSIFVADTDGEFALTVPNSTVNPATIIGSSGLVPLSWHWSHLRHGAPQVNGRFEREFKRRMTDRDWSAWIAIRSLSESILRTKSTKTKTIKKFMISKNFKVDGSKGVSLNYKSITKQLRQTIFLTSSNNWVTAVAPLENFQNRENNLDSLGINNSENKCEKDKL